MSPVAFLTGASCGIGRGLAGRLAASGYAVALAARRVHVLDEAAREIRERGGRAEIVPCDVANRDQVLAAVERAVDRLGPVELLVAAAGVDWRTRPEALDGRRVEAQMRINFLGAVHAAEAVLPSMLERGRGHLVVVGSLAGYGGLPLSAGYSASKAALDKFFESLRVDLRGTGVAVTVVTPGYVRTAMTAANPYPMPFLVELDDALDRIERAIRRRGRRVGFPWPLWIQAVVGQILPRAAYDRAVSRMDRDRPES